MIAPENIAIARIGTIETGPYVSGSLQPRREAVLRAELAAQVAATYAEKGDAVAAGELLLRLEAAELRDAVRSAERAVATAEQAAAYARSNVRRAEVLFEAGGVALRDVEDARLNLATAEAQLATARTQLATAREQLADTEVRAPFAGRIAERHVGAGDVVQPGTDLYTVIDPSTMRLEAEVPAEHLGAARVGAPVRFQVRGYPAFTFGGVVSAVGPAADSATRQIQLVITIPNAAGSLVADLYADGRIESEARKGLVIPEDAIDEAGAGPTVLAVRQGRATRVGVTLGLRDERTATVEVTAGLVAGDTVLIGAARAVTEGARVVVRTAAAARPRR
ncbi:MAG TPA: efflux RND transporter periplasmic adaptor subunit [Longimicrobiales bacterium]